MADTNIFRFWLFLFLFGYGLLWSFYLYLRFGLLSVGMDG